MATAQRPLDGFVLELAAVGDGMLDLVGGKAAHLGRLSRAGLPVPAGFCLTTRAYEQAVGDALAEVLEAAERTAAADQEALRGLAEQARRVVASATVPDAVAAAVIDAYRALGGGPVAVRSSATAEDLPFASFAGQQDTYLNVVGPEAVLDAVHRCWVSLWTDRAVTYRAAGGIAQRDVRLAVVVQRLVVPAVAGVMFTANPVTGCRTETVIDASPGLGEAVVSGAVNPDHLVADSATGTVRERRLGDKRLVIRPVEGGGIARHVRLASDDGDAGCCLTDEQVRDLVALGRRVTALYGAEQDVEWVLTESGRLWLTQARAIPSLFPVPVRPDAEGLRVFFCFSLAQGLTRPLTPMGLATLRVFGSSVSGFFGRPLDDVVAGPAVAVVAGCRLFVDLTAVARNAAGRRAVPRVFDLMETRAAAVLRELFDDPRLSVRPGSGRAFARQAVAVAARTRMPLRVVHAVARPRAALRAQDAVEADVRAWPPATDGASAADRLERVVEAAEQAVGLVVPRVGPIMVAGLAMLALAARLLGPDATAAELQGVLRSLPHNVTTEMDLDLWRLAARLRDDSEASRALESASADDLAQAWRDGALPPALQQGLAGFLRRYGHRAVAEIDVGMPRWSQDPAHLFGILRNYRRLDDPYRAPDAVFSRGAVEAQALVSVLTARAHARRGLVPGRVRSALVGLALRRAREFVGVREFPKYCLVLLMARLRAELEAVGAELAARGLLGHPDDVFFLDLDQARTAAGGQDLSATVALRRAEYERELRRRHVPRVLLSDGTEPEAVSRRAPESADGALVGTPASPGTVTGRARVVLDPVGAHLEPGEILVTPSTDPGWTPLFLTAGGLVMEMGGPNSHGAVVAREYGIPAVVGVPGATTTLVTGQQITVDGSRGVVT